MLEERCDLVERCGQALPYEPERDRQLAVRGFARRRETRRPGVFVAVQHHKAGVSFLGQRRDRTEHHRTVPADQQ
jgi:hypothetical protein